MYRHPTSKSRLSFLLCNYCIAFPGLSLSLDTNTPQQWIGCLSETCTPNGLLCTNTDQYVERKRTYSLRCNCNWSAPPNPVSKKSCAPRLARKDERHRSSSFLVQQPTKMAPSQDALTVQTIWNYSISLSNAEIDSLVNNQKITDKLLNSIILGVLPKLPGHTRNILPVDAHFMQLLMKESHLNFFCRKQSIGPFGTNVINGIKIFLFDEGGERMRFLFKGYHWGQSLNRWGACPPPATIMPRAQFNHFRLSAPS